MERNPIKRNIFIIFCVIVTMLSFCLTCFADYVSVQGPEDVYDIDSSIGLDMLYSNGVWGSTTIGYISLDATPVPGSAVNYASDTITMTRYDGTNHGFELNSGYIRYVSESYNGLVIDHGLGGGTLTSSQLSKMTLYATQPIVYDTGKLWGGGMPLYYIKNSYPGPNNVYARIEFSYISKNGTKATYTMRPEPYTVANDGLQYTYFNLYSDELTAILKENALTASGLALISDLKVEFEYDQSSDAITDATLGLYQYFPKKGYDDINNGDIRIVTVDKYVKALAQSSYNSGVIDGGQTDFLGAIYRGVDGFLNADLFGTFSLGDVVSTMICVLVVVAFLKSFAGG